MFGGAAYPGLTYPISAHSCYGAVTGNDQPLPTTNLGYLNDGILNGASVATGNSTSLDVFGNGAFLSGNYTASKLDPNGAGNDPGWVYLGKDDAPGGASSFSPATIGGVAGISLASWFSITQLDSGIWQWHFTPDKDVVSRASALFGTNYFDQFALVFKQQDAFAVYNFTGAQFGVDHPMASDPILNFHGTADLRTVFNGTTGLSHVSIWARDPGSTSVVPEPGSLVLFASALLGLIGVERKRRISRS